MLLTQMKRKNKKMTMELKTDIKLPYINEEDAFEIFATVVDNNQTSLALQVLVDIMATLINKVNELDEIVSEIVNALSEDEEEIIVQAPEIKKEEVLIIEEKTPIKQVTKSKVEPKKEDVEITQ